MCSVRVSNEPVIYAARQPCAQPTSVLRDLLMFTVAAQHSTYTTCQRTNCQLSLSQWRRSQVKSGGINIEKIEGVGSGEGLCPPQLGVWGLAPRKKNLFCAKNYAILSKFSYFFPTLQQKVGGDYPP